MTTLLSERELERTLAIKAAALDDKSLPVLSDFEYAQHALVAKDKTKIALERMSNLADFRSKYDIKDSLDDSIQSMQNFHGLFPNFRQGFGKDMFGHGFQVLDYSKFSPPSSNDTHCEDFKVYMKGVYYSFVAMSSDLETVRKGTVWITRTNGVRQCNVNLDTERQSGKLWQRAYPIRIKKIVLLDPPAIVFWAVGILKMFLSAKIKSAIEVAVGSNFCEAWNSAVSPDCLPEGLGGSSCEDTVMEMTERSLKSHFECVCNFTLSPFEERDDGSSYRSGSKSLGRGTFRDSMVRVVPFERTM